MNQADVAMQSQDRIIHFERMNIRLINRVLFLATAVFAGWVGYQVRGTSRDGAVLLPVDDPGRPGMAVAHTYQKLEERAYYSEKINRRDIFSPVAQEDMAPSGADVYDTLEAVKKRLEQARGELVVVGVSWREPQMVFLYDKRRNKTYFLTENQEIGDNTGITVRSISRTKIKISLETEETYL